MCHADEKDLEEKSEGLRKELALWEAVLSKSPFLAGDTFTLADVAAGACRGFSRTQVEGYLCVM